MFPHSLDQVAANATEHKRWYVPDHNNWFELTGKTGDEKFILLASLDRLKELESSLREYEEMDQTKRKILAPKIIADIQSLRRRHFDPKTTAEKPVSMIGNVRDVSDTNSAKAYDIANFAVEISAEKFYGKTFTIYHRK